MSTIHTPPPPPAGGTPPPDPSAPPAAPPGPGGATDPAGTQAAMDEFMEAAGYVKDAEGKWVPADGQLDGVGEILGIEEMIGDWGQGGGAGAVGPDGVTPASDNMSAEDREGAAAFAENVDQAFHDAFVKGYDENGNPIVKSFEEMSSEDLFVAFMKLNLGDPSLNPENQAVMREVLKNVRKGMLESQRAQEEEAIKKEKEASEKNESTKVFGIIATVVMVVAACVIAAFTFGAGAALVALAVIAAAAIIGGLVAQSQGGKFMDGFMMGAMIGAALVMLVCSFGASTPLLTAISTGVAVANAGIMVAKAKVQYDAQQAALDAEEANALAKRFGMKAEQLQEMIKELQEFMAQIVQSKADLMALISKMLGQFAVTNAKINTIAVGR